MYIYVRNTISARKLICTTATAAAATTTLFFVNVTNQKVAGSRPDGVNDFYQVT
jgi:hypothetical protein